MQQVKSPTSPTASTVSGFYSPGSARRGNDGGAKKASTTGGGGSSSAANAYFRHSLGSFVPDAATYFADCCASGESPTPGSSSSLGLVRSVEMFEMALTSFASSMYARMGSEMFPCAAADASSTTLAEGTNRAAGDVFRGSGEVEDIETDRPSSVGNPIKRIPLGYEVNESLQGLLHDTFLPQQLNLESNTGGKPSKQLWSRSREARKRAEDMLLPFAEAAYRRRIGSGEMDSAPSTITASSSATSHSRLSPRISPFSWWLAEGNSSSIAAHEGAQQQGRWYADHHAAVLVHIWARDDAANSAFRAAQRLQQLLYEYSLVGLHGVVSVLYCVHGEYVQVVAMPPVVPTHVQIATDRDDDGVVLNALCRELLLVLRLPLAVSSRAAAVQTSSNNGLKVLVGADGRSYVWDGWSKAAVLMSHLLPELTAAAAALAPSVYCPKSDLLEQYIVHTAQSDPACVAQAAHNNSEQPAGSGHHLSLHEYIVSMLFPIVLQRFIVSFGDRDKPLRSTAAVIKDQVLISIMKDLSVPCRYLYQLFDFAKKWLVQQNVQSAATKLSRGESVVSESVDAIKAVKTLCDVCQTEMAARALKDMVLFDIRSQAGKGFIGEPDQLEAINRVLRSFSTKDAEFWSGALTNCVRRKFFVEPSTSSTATPFVVEPTRVHIASVLKMVSSRTGAILVPDRNRFEAFASVRDTGVFSVTHTDYLGCTRGSVFPLAESHAKLCKVNELVWNTATAAKTDESLSVISLYNAWEARNTLVACHNSYLLPSTEALVATRAISSVSSTLRAASVAAPVDALKCFQLSRCARLLAQASLSHAEELNHADVLTWAIPSVASPSNNIISSAAAGHVLRLSITAALTVFYMAQKVLQRWPTLVMSSSVARAWNSIECALQLQHNTASVEHRPQCVMLLPIVEALHRRAGLPTSVTPAGTLPMGMLEFTRALAGFVSLCATQRNSSQLMADAVVKYVSGCLSSSPGVFSIPSRLPNVASSADASEREASLKVTPSTAFNDPQDDDVVLPCTPDIVTIRKLLAHTTAASLVQIRHRQGIRNVNSVMLTYILGFSSLQYLHACMPDMSDAAAASGTTLPPLLTTVPAGANAIRKILEKALLMNPKQQQQSATTPVPSSVIYKIHCILQRAAADHALAANMLDFSPTSALLLYEHVAVFAPSLIAAYVLQRIGRGSVGRRQVSLKQHRRPGGNASPPVAAASSASSPVAQDHLLDPSPLQRQAVSPGVHVGRSAVSPDAAPSVLGVEVYSPPPTRGEQATSLNADLGDGIDFEVTEMYGGGGETAEQAVSAAAERERELLLEVQALHGEETLGRKAVVLKEVEGRVQLHTAAESDCKSIAWRVLKEKIDALSSCEATARAAVFESDSVFQELFGDDEVVTKTWAPCFQRFVDRQQAHAALLESLTLVEEVAARNQIVQAEARGLVFLSSVSERSAAEATALERARLDEVDRRQSSMSPLWESEQASYRQHTSSVGSGSRSHSPVHGTSGSSSPVGLVDPDSLPRAPSPLSSATLLVRTRGHLARPPTAGDTNASEEPRMEDAPVVVFTDVEPLSPLELDNLIRRWSELRDNIGKGDIAVDLNEAVEALGAVKATSAGDRSNYYEAWLAAEAEARDVFSPQRLKSPGCRFSAQVELKPLSSVYPAPRQQLAVDVLRAQESTWQDLVACASDVIQDAVSPRVADMSHPDTPDAPRSPAQTPVLRSNHPNCIPHLWTSRRAARAYLRSLRALHAVCYEVLHLSPIQFIVPVSVKFSFAMSIATATFVPSLSTTNVKDGRGDDGASPFVDLICRILDAVFSSSATADPQNPNSTAATYVTVTALPDCSGRCLVVPTAALLERCATSIQHPALGNHIPNALVFCEVGDDERRLDMSVEQCAVSVKQHVSKAGNISPRALVLMAHRHGVPIRALWRVLECETLRGAALPSRALENIWAAAITTLVSRALKQLAEVASSDAVKELCFGHEDEDVASASQAATLVTVARLLRSFSRSTTMLQTHLAHILRVHYGASMASMNVNLVSVAGVIREVCRSFGLAEADVQAVQAEGEMRHDVPSSPLSSGSSPAVPSHRLPSHERYSVGVAAFPIMLGATAPRRLGSLSKGPSSKQRTGDRAATGSRVAQLTVRAWECQELLKSIVVLQRRQGDELQSASAERYQQDLLFAVCAKALYCDAHDASSCAAVASCVSKIPLGELLVQRHFISDVRPMDNNAAVNSQKSLSLGSANNFVDLAVSRLFNDVSVTHSPTEQLWVAHETLQWLQDELATLAAAAHAQKSRIRSNVAAVEPPVPQPQWGLYRFALRVVEYEEAGLQFPSRASRVEKIVECLVQILCIRAAMSYVGQTAPVSNTSPAASNFILDLAQREIEFVTRLSQVLARETFLRKELRAFLAAKLTCEVSVPTLLWLVVTDQPSVVCNAYKDLADSAVWMCWGILSKYGRVGGNGDDHEGLVGAMVSAMELLLCPVLFIGAKGSLASAPSQSLRGEDSVQDSLSDKQEKKLTVLSLQLQELLRSWIAFERGSDETEEKGSGKMISGPVASLESLIVNHHRSVDYVRTLIKLLIFVLFHGPTPMSSVVAYFSLSGGILDPSNSATSLVSFLPFPESELSLDDARDICQRWVFVPTTPYSHAGSALVEVETQAMLREHIHETLCNNVLRGMRAQFDNHGKNIHDRDAEAKLLDAQERNKQLIHASRELELEWVARRDELSKDAFNGLSSFYTSCRDTVEFLYEEDRSLKRALEYIENDAHRSIAALTDAEGNVWDAILSHFYDVLRLLDDQAAARDDIMDEEDEWWERCVVDALEEDKQWILNIADPAMSPERVAPLQRRPHSRDGQDNVWGEFDQPSALGVESPTLRTSSIRPDSRDSRPPTGRRDTTPRQPSRQSSRQRPVIPPSPLTGRRPAAVERGNPPVEPSAEDYITGGQGSWQHITPQHLGDTFVSFPPPSTQTPDDDGTDEDEDEDDDGNNEHGSIDNNHGAPASCTGLPPRPLSGSSFLPRKLIDQRKIAPAEYYSADYIEKLRVRSSEWQQHRWKTCGTQTGATPPPTPPLGPVRAALTPIDGQEHFSCDVPAAPMHTTPLDILYQSAQALHVMGEALTVLFFMDVALDDAAIAAANVRPVFRVPSALRSNRARDGTATVSRPSSSSSAKVSGDSQSVRSMRQKMKLLEAECSAFQVDSCIIDERRLRKRLLSDQLNAWRILLEMEDSAKLVVQEQLCQMPRAAVRGDGTHHEHQDVDGELRQLRVAAHAYMHGGAKQLRPPIPAPGFSETFARRSKSHKGLLPPATLNTATSVLRALQAELAELEPATSKKLPPIQGSRQIIAAETPRAAAISIKSNRGSSAGFRSRPVSPGLPHLQKTKLTATVLPPIVASVLPDRDFSRASLTLPPLTGAQSRPLATPLGLVLPEVAHSVVEIARLKQEAEAEIMRETYATVNTFEQAGKSCRPSSAIASATTLDALPASLQRATHRSLQVSTIQTFARALEARDVACRRAMRKVLSWLRRVIRRLWKRRKSLSTQKLAHKNCKIILRRFTEMWADYTGARRAFVASARDVLWEFVGAKVDAVNRCTTLSHTNQIRLVGCFFHRLHLYRRAQRRQRTVGSQAATLRRVLQVRYFERWFRHLLSLRNPDAQIHKVDNLRRIQRKANITILQRYFSKFEQLYICGAQRKEATYRLRLLIEERRQRNIGLEVDRVWCIAMIRSGWARKYLKPFFLELQRRVIAKHPQLANKKWLTRPPDRKTQ